MHRQGPGMTCPVSSQLDRNQYWNHTMLCSSILETRDPGRIQPMLRCFWEQHDSMLTAEKRFASMVYQRRKSSKSATISESCLSFTITLTCRQSMKWPKMQAEIQTHHFHRGRCVEGRHWRVICLPGPTQPDKPKQNHKASSKYRSMHV